MRLHRLLKALTAIALLVTFMTSCGNDDELNILQNRIVGEWKLTQEAEEDVSTRNWRYTFNNLCSLIFLYY